MTLEALLMTMARSQLGREDSVIIPECQYLRLDHDSLFQSLTALHGVNLILAL